MATLFIISLSLFIVVSLITALIAFKNKSKKTKKEAQRKPNHKVEHWDKKETYYEYVSQADYNRESSNYSPYSVTGRSYAQKFASPTRCDCTLYDCVDTNNANVYRGNNGDYSDRVKLYGRY